MGRPFFAPGGYDPSADGARCGAPPEKKAGPEAQIGALFCNGIANFRYICN